MTSNNKIETLIQTFSEEIRAVVRQELADMIGLPSAQRRRAPRAAPAAGRILRAKPAKVAKPAKAATPAAKAKPARRDPQALEKLRERVRAQIARTPGRSSGELAKAIRADPAAMDLPLRQLVDAGKVRGEGATRARRYFPAATAG